MFPRVFGDKFGDEFGDKFSELPNLMIILVMNSGMNLVTIFMKNLSQNVVKNTVIHQIE